MSWTKGEKEHFCKMVYYGIFALILKLGLSAFDDMPLWEFTGFICYVWSFVQFLYNAHKLNRELFQTITKNGEL